MTMTTPYDQDDPTTLTEPRDTLEWLRHGAMGADDYATEERAEAALDALDRLEAELADARAALARMSGHPGPGKPWSPWA